MKAEEKLHTDKIQAESLKNTTLEEQKIAEEKQFTDTINTLDPLYYYNKDFKKFSLQMAFTEQTPYMNALANEIANHLKTLGIDIQITTLATEDLQTIIAKGDKQYSLLLTGINLGLFDYNIFPFFHSGQAEKGFNFAKIKNIPLDILLEKLKSTQLNTESLKFIQSQIIDILKQENIFMPLYSPYNTLYLDKTLKQIPSVPVIPYSSSLYDVTENMYIKESLEFQWDNKSLDGFINWLKIHSPFIYK